MSSVRKIVSLLSVIILVLCASACGTDTSDAIIYFELESKPSTLDAQVAKSDSEVLIVNNIYEGLLRHNESGAIVCAACEDYSLDGLTYTFNIRKDLKWSNGTSVTADDFVFAFQRAVSPTTKSPFVSRLFSVKGAKEVYNGGNPANLGVTAVDEYTLKIDLKERDDNFDETLTTSVCMPCNRAFFEECGGKYGLTVDAVITNGPYTVTKWNTDDFGIRIYESDDYCGDFTAKNSAVFFSKNDDESTCERISENKVDMGFLSDEEFAEAKSSDISVVSTQNSMLLLKINDKFPKNMKESFARLISGKLYTNSLKGSYVAANSIYPEALKIDSCENIGFSVYDLQRAQKLFADSVKAYDNEKFPSSTLYYYDDEFTKEIATAIVSQWQQKFSAFVNIKPVSDADTLKKSITDKNDMDFTLFPICAENTSLREYLSQLGVTYNGEKPADIQSKLLSSYSVIPIAFFSKHIAYSNSIGRVYGKLEGSQIDFCYITKTE